MTKPVKLLFLSFTILLTFSCRKQVDVDYEEIQPVPVINSLIEAGEVIKAHVSYTAVPEGDQLQGTQQGTVELWVNDEFSRLLSPQRYGWYESTTIAEQGNTYKIRWVYSDTDYVEGSTYIPPSATLSNIEHTEVAGMNEEGVTYPSVSFTIDNIQDGKQYFEVRMRLFRYGSVSNAQLEEIVDPVLINEGLPMWVFSNELIETDSYRMTINYTTGSSTSSGGQWITRLFPFVLELRSVSEEYYLFARQKYLYDSGRFPEFGLGANTAFPLYSNIDGGYGLVAGFSSFSSDTITPTY